MGRVEGQDDDDYDRRDRKHRSRRRSDDDSDGSEDRRKSRKRRRRENRKHEDSDNSTSSDEDRRSKKKRRHKDKDDSQKRDRDKDRQRSDRRRDREKTKKKKKRHKKKSSKKEDRKERKRSRKDKYNNEEDIAGRPMKELERNYVLAEALHELLLEHPTPSMAKDTLPLVLLKLGGGTSLDLSQMPDKRASQGIQRVLKALQPFGVGEEEPQVWKWTVPGGRADERFLLKIVRTMLNDVGFTMGAIERMEKKKEEEEQEDSNMGAKQPKVETAEDSEFAKIQDHTVKMLQSLQTNNHKQQSTSSLPGELGGLCKMLLEGESVALDGLPDAKLKAELESLFEKCGLQLQEMEDDSDRDDDNNDEAQQKQPTMGYGLPESPEQERLVQAKLLSVLKACETVASAPPAARTKGPTPMPAGYQAPDESSDEEGPAPVGVARRDEPPPVSKELIQHQAEMRARQLRGAVSGNLELMSTDPNTREEWMLDPGKFDFLSSIKAGNPMKSRTFQAKAKASDDEASSRVAMDPKIKAEVDAIMQAHHESRGPTLVEQHRLKKMKEREENVDQKGEWKWCRDKDLDSGRRVDKNALHMVLGGASEDLKKKFQGGY